METGLLRGVYARRRRVLKITAGWGFSQKKRSPLRETPPVGKLISFLIFNIPNFINFVILPFSFKKILFI